MNDFISRKEAIEYFMTNTNWHDEDGYPIDDASEKRKLLEDYFSGVPSVECKDAVSREDALICLTGTYLSDYKYDELISKFAKRINSLPSIIPKPKMGEWLHLELIPDDITGHMHGECSMCHKVRIIDNFCPNCGAKMKP